MNNEQFRRLITVENSTPKTSNDATNSPRAARQGDRLSLESRQKPTISMMPRAVLGNTRNGLSQRIVQSEKSSSDNTTLPARCQGSKTGSKADSKRVSDGDDERAVRLKALDDSFRNQEIDQDTYDRLRGQIVGGDFSSTHLVKGLDFKLLERIRNGEDIYTVSAAAKSERFGTTQTQESPDPLEKQNDTLNNNDADDAVFDRIAEKEVAAIPKDKTVKRGQMAPAGALIPGKKRTRDQILAEMKAARAAAAAATKAKEESSLSSRFRKISNKKVPGSRIERDAQGREVLIIVDEDGHERRKIRKTSAAIIPTNAEVVRKAQYLPPVGAKPLGMEVPDVYKKLVRQQSTQDEEGTGDDIFDDAGDDYNPLAGIENGSGDSDEESGNESGNDSERKREDGEVKENITRNEHTAKKDSLHPLPAAPSRRDYFVGSKTKLVSQEGYRAPSMSDPAIQAALKKAAALKARSSSSSGDLSSHRLENDEDRDETVARAREEKRKQMLSNVDRDAEDMDLGFGTSRFEDEEDADMEDCGIKLSEWGDGDDVEDRAEGTNRGGKKRKRGPKKRKGDANNAADVLRAMERMRSEK